MNGNIILDHETKKLCLECSIAIPNSAKKCVECGSYQNWRRFIPFGEATLALVLSLIALFGHLVPDPRAIIKSAGDYISGTNFALSTALVEITEQHVVILVSNQSGSTAVLRSANCMIYLALDNMARGRKTLTETAEGKPYRGDRKFLRDETVGPFLTSYVPDEPLIIGEYSEVVFKAKFSRVSPPLGDHRLMYSKEGDKTVVGLCIIDGVDESNSLAVGGILLQPSEVQNIDALIFLELADYAPHSEPKRIEWISKIEAIRAKSNADSP